jgi:hypothetical protein
MAAPNIVNVTSIKGKTGFLAVTTNPTAIVTCGANTVLKVNGIFITNIHSSDTASVTVDISRGGTARHLARNIGIPVNEMIDILGSKALYLEENDFLRITGSAASVLEAVCTYEEIA